MKSQKSIDLERAYDCESKELRFKKFVILEQMSQRKKAILEKKCILTETCSISQ